MTSHSRDDLRRAYTEAWHKHVAGTPLTPLETMIVDVIGLHPEYVSVVSDGEAALAYEVTAMGATDNPFLHMGLHLAVREQLAIDRPACGNCIDGCRHATAASMMPST
jgi:Domain of unknown function (DUF1841)